MYAQLCPTLVTPMGCSPPGSSVHGISQARILEWVAIFHSRGSSWPRDWTCISCIGRQILNHCATWGSLRIPLITPKLLCTHYCKFYRLLSYSRVSYSWFILGWCKSNCGFALLSCAVWYWNTFLNTCVDIMLYIIWMCISHFVFLLMTYYLLFILYLF